MKLYFDGELYTLEQIRLLLESGWSDDLLKPNYRKMKSKDAPKSTGHCYVTSEMLYYENIDHYHVTVMFMKISKTVNHWFLLVDGQLIDFTADQFDKPLSYDRAKRSSFLTNYASKRAVILKKKIIENTDQYSKILEKGLYSREADNRL